ncbi:MAG TPA: hypothetical protein VL989_00865 [Candidatus Sulfotelmatobacter sp.]|nr:hypothetical protein [Candidatus Sulfotelmatobacter sp.]
MASIMDKVHTVGMSEDRSTYLTVDAYYGDDNINAIAIEPPLQITLEGEDAHVAFVQGAMAARYHDDELRQIGEGSSTLGIKRVIGEIAMSSGLESGATKPLHPNLIDGDVIVDTPLELPAPRRELTA